MTRSKTVRRAAFAAVAVVAIGGLAIAAQPLATGRFTPQQARIYGVALERTHAGVALERLVGGIDAALELELTPQQKTQVKPILAQAAMSLRRVHLSAASPQVKMTQAKAILESTRASLRSILSPTQNASVDAFRARLEDIGITREQRSQLWTAASQAVTAAREVRRDATLSPERKQAQVVTIFDQVRLDAERILTPEQQEKLRALRDGGLMANVIAHTLDLTEHQKAEVQGTLRFSFAQWDAVHADRSLSPEQRLSRLQQIREAAIQRIGTVLTPEQRQKADTLRKRFHEMRTHRSPWRAIQAGA